MKKLYLLCTLLAIALTGCVEFEEPIAVPQQKEVISSVVRTRASASGSHEVNPDNPYSLSNVQRALRTISGYSTTTLSPTHKYVRFLPQDTTDMYILVDSLNLPLFSYPIDYELSLAEMEAYENATINGYAWQYCLVAPDFRMPTEMTGELLDYAYLQSESPGTRAPIEQLDQYVYGAAIDKAMELTGNATPQTRASAWTPSATITYNSGVDNEATIGLKNVLVRVNTFFNSGEGYTDASGRVTISRGWGGKFRNATQYKIIWATDKWKIHDGSGKSKHEGPKQKAPWPLEIDGGESSELAMCATIHRGLNAYYNESITKAAGLVKVDHINVRAHWNRVNDNGASAYFSKAKYNQIHIFSHYRDFNNNLTPSTSPELLFATFHELGHASHWQTVINWPGMNRHDHFTNSNIKETWAEGVAYAYMSSMYPERFQDEMRYQVNPKQNPSGNDYTAFIESLMTQGISLSTLQNIFMGKRYLEDCIQPIKALGTVPDAIVDLIFSDACRYDPIRINMANPITGSANPSLNTQTTYSVPAIITTGIDANAPSGTRFMGWTVAPASGYTTIGGLAGRTLNIRFTAEGTYTITANFTLPDGSTHSVTKTVVAEELIIPISGPDNPSVNTNATYTIPTDLPAGVVFDGWTVSPSGSFMVIGGTVNHNLTIQFTAKVRRTITANFTLPDGTSYSTSKEVTSQPELLIPTQPSTPKIVGTTFSSGGRFTVTNPTSGATYLWELDGVLQSGPNSHGSVLNVSSDGSPIIIKPIETFATKIVTARCKASLNGTTTEWSTMVSIRVP